MRIISGKFKGKSISYLKSLTTRPLKDSVKENIFNIINHSNILGIDLENSNVLDLYSGIGSFGIECISRGIKQITFVENDKYAVKTLNENLVQLNVQNIATVIVNDVSTFLDSKINTKFEIIFLDPPFANNDYIENLKKIKSSKIYNDNHIVIIHRENKTIDNFENILKPIVVKEYGRSKIIFGRF